MKQAYSVVKSLIHTEKGTEMQVQNKYLFWVDKGANKIEIKNAVEEIYNVTVTGVNTLIVNGKRKRMRYQEGMTPEWKKAMVSLKSGDKIDVA
jgi:large subunit ribosomal protein L23